MKLEPFKNLPKKSIKELWIFIISNLFEPIYNSFWHYKQVRELAKVKLLTDIPKEIRFTNLLINFFRL